MKRLKHATKIVTRRAFLRKSFQSGTGLSLALMLPGCVEPEDATKTAAIDAPDMAGTPFVANAFVTIGQDSTVTVQIKHVEMGQGPYTGLATLVAEELDADWDQVVAVAAPAEPAYHNLHWGMQATGGSSAITNSFEQMREAGAVARYMLVGAASQSWDVPAAKIEVTRGVISHAASNRQASFGELASLAAEQALPDFVTLKSPKDFVLIGTTLSRKDIGKTDGSAVFTQDIQLPNMLTAVVAHPPRYGATLASFDATAAKELPGVVDVLALDNGVAVLARTFWQAKQARDALDVSWNEDNAFVQSSADLFAHYRQRAETPGDSWIKEGDLAAAFEGASQIVEAVYEVPFLAHATMEPMNCVIQFNGTEAEFWYGCQFQTVDQAQAAQVLGIAPEKVKINTLLAGGSFGRRANAHSDYVLETTQIAKAHGKSVPIKLVWTREDDTNAGYFRPMYVHRLKAALDDAGNIAGWQHRIVGQSISKGTMFEPMIQNGVDPQTVEGAHVPYAIPAQEVETHAVDLPVPVLWWRSVASTHTAYVTEAFIDELAAAAGRDPLEFRMSMLDDQPRHQQVLALAAEKAGWGSPLPSGRARGIAVHQSFGTYVAEVAEVSVAESGDYKVEKVTCAVDCGIAVNPDVIRAQMEGGIGFGLSPAMLSEITFENGAMVQSSFHDYKVLRINQMPDIDVHIVPSAEAPTGVGEPSTPVAAPALANALFAATSIPRRKLPIGLKV